VADVRIRPADESDTKAVYPLFAEWQEEVFGEAEIGPKMFASAVASADAAFVAETAGGVVGHADVRGGDIEVVVGMAARRRGIGTALLAEAERAATADPVLLAAVTLEPAGAPFARANGYEKAWEYWLMAIDLPDEVPPPRWPDGVSVRPFGDEDAAPVKELLDLAYAAEPHHRPLRFEHWRRFMLEDPSFDPTAWFLVEANGGLVGAALNWKEGYVKDLVVRPDWQRRGLGTALMLQTFGEFARRGIRRVALKTDSINPTHAWRLYERLGMRKERTYEVFAKRLSKPVTSGV
jgi:mycothiol synthase